MKKYLAFAAVAGFLPALVLAPMQAAPAPKAPAQGDREVILSGSGSSDGDFDSNTIGLRGSFAQYLTDNTALGVRQEVEYSDRPERPSRWRGVTDVFAQWHFGRSGSVVRPFAGASVGYLYGDEITDSWVAGPELGAKWYVQERTFILTQLDYQFTFRDAQEADENWDDGRFRYQLGIGYNF